MEELVILIQIIFSVIDSKNVGTESYEEKLCIQGKYYDICDEIRKILQKE